jgi:hypothetical protein
VGNLISHIKGITWTKGVSKQGAVENLWGKAIGGWRKHKKEVHNVYSSPNIISMIKSMRMRWTTQVECKRNDNAYRTFVRKPERKSTWKTQL